MNNWKTGKLSTLCSRIGDGLHGTPNYDEDGDVFFINGNNLKDGKIEIFPDTKKVSESELKKNHIPLNSNSLLIGINGTLGNMAFYNGEKLMLGKSSAYLNFKSNINKFYYYYFQLPGVQKFFYDVATGSTIKNLSLGSLNNFVVPIPDGKEAHKIAAVLSALDDKIELNNKINIELEKMAKTLYDYWFVQFDFPFDFGQGKPSEEAKPYKSSGGEMVYNAVLKREIPKGWEVKNISDIAEIIDCLHSKKPEFNHEADFYYLAQLENISSTEMFDDSYRFFVSKKDYDKWTKRIELKENDILVTNAGRVAANCQIPKNVICGIGRNITAIRPTYLHTSYLHLAFKGFDIQNQIKINTDKGAFFHSFNVKGIKLLNFVIPTEKVIKVFEPIAKSIRYKKEANLKQNQELASLRDWLLPMLMNGQVRVGESDDKVLGLVAEEKSNYQKN